MPSKFDKWTVLKIFEWGFAIACLICKAITDDEASRLFLYLQKFSREWSLLNSVTWDKIGDSVADATYGGYVIITGALLIGKLSGDLPTTKRVTEMVLLGLGALLYVVLGSLEFASLDSIPPDLVDNAAVIGTLSLITAALFLLDLGSPRAEKPQRHTLILPKALTKELESKTKRDLYDVEKEIEKRSSTQETSIKLDAKSKEGDIDVANNKNNQTAKSNGVKPGNGEKSKRFDIYGKDAEEDDKESELDFDDTSSKKELHSPVWSKIRKGQYGKYDVVTPTFLYPKQERSETEESAPSGPGDPGYVQYTAKTWGQQSQKTPRHSPTEV